METTEKRCIDYERPRELELTGKAEQDEEGATLLPWNNSGCMTVM